MKRVHMQLEVDVYSTLPQILCLSQTISEKPCTARPEFHHRISVPLAPVEVSVPWTPARSGERTSSLKVLDVHSDAHTMTLRLEAPGGTTQNLHVRRNNPGIGNLAVDGATLQGNDLVIPFEAGLDETYRVKTITVRW